MQAHRERWIHHRWAHLVLLICAVFHIGMSVVILFAPVNMVVTDGTLPVFALMGRPGWSLTFLIAGVAALFLAIQPTIVRQLMTWITVVPLGFVWTGTFAVAAIEGRGSVALLLAWPTLLAVWVVAGLWIATHEALTPPGGR